MASTSTTKSIPPQTEENALADLVVESIAVEAISLAVSESEANSAIPATSNASASETMSTDENFSPAVMNSGPAQNQIKVNIPALFNSRDLSAEITPPNVAQHPYTISEAQVIRLYNSVVVTDQSPNTDNQFRAILSESRKSLNSYGSSDDVGTCRICRWNRSDMEVLHCPCLCKGTVGFVHLQCLKRWMLLRRNSNCEICNSRFNVPEERLNFRRMLSSFFSKRCCGAIMRNLLFCTSLLPLTNVILQQVLTCMERLNVSTTDTITIKEVMLGTFALLTSSALFFHVFEFITTRFLHCRHLLRQWWFFGNTPDFTEMELDESLSDYL